MDIVFFCWVGIVGLGLVGDFIICYDDGDFDGFFVVKVCWVICEVVVDDVV